MIKICPGGSWLFPGHRFEGRFESPKGMTNIISNNLWGETTTESGITTYIRDVCVKCGKTIERPSQKSINEQLERL